MDFALDKSGFVAVTGGAALVTQVLLNRLQITSPWLPLSILTAAPALSQTICNYLGFETPWTVLSPLITSYALFYLILSTSVTCYRLSPLHPMYEYPGPLLARISKFWAMWIAFSGRQHVVYKELHEKHGPFVRIGPNELSISDPNAIPAVLGVGGLPRGRFYEVHADPDAPKNLVVLKGEEHQNRKRLWKRGMSPEALEEYSSMIAERANLFLDRVAEIPAPVDLVSWFGYFSFDCMGDMIFGGGFEMLRDGADKDELWSLIEGYFFAATLFCHIPWIAKPLTRIPIVARRFVKLRSFGASFAATRVKKGSMKKDLWYHLIDEAGLEKVKPAEDSVISDGTLAIITGADTSARVLAAFFYFLLSDRVLYDRVRQEIDSVFPDGDVMLSTSKYEDLVFLDACIMETLRLLPPVPTGGRRRVFEGMGGRVICDRFVPEGTEIYIPPYVLQRDPKNFSPFTDEFWPDRWLQSTSPTSKTDPTFVHNAAAFVAFSHGPGMCVAKNLARLEMKMLVSRLLRRYDVQFAGGFDKEEWMHSLRDYFVMRPTKPLNVVFYARDSN
ncbi:cytochrome P450 [Schizopora paradoxa]|uniref:Cytochrome P450 n=1 Tax=Schizopora paradoxa TaxID=27342 RepID=A0A0H2RUT7_9AGAM|nr:cytochrome P450 [Schizopora paradoxa]